MLDQASVEDVVVGAAWYRKASDIACRIAKHFHISKRKACGVVAALSPGCTWEQSLYDAVNVCQSRGWVKVSTYKDNLIKALKILHGEDPEEILGGLKTFCFFHNIMNPETSTLVTVDRHAIRIAAGTRKLSDRRMSRLSDTAGYHKIAEAYRSVADAVGLTPPEIQAITWVAFRSQLNQGVG